MDHPVEIMHVEQRPGELPLQSPDSCTLRHAAQQVTITTTAITLTATKNIQGVH